MAEEYKFETRCIHGNGGLVEGHPYGAVSVPIFQTATFAHPGIGRSTGYDYTRESNPTRHELESVMSTLEEADDSIACTSGMAAIGLCLELFEEGSHILCTEDLYGGTVRMFESIGEKRGVTFSYIDTSDIELVRKSIRKETKALYIETPSNPTMKVTDFAAMREIADEYGLSESKVTVTLFRGRIAQAPEAERPRRTIPMPSRPLPITRWWWIRKATMAVS